MPRYPKPDNQRRNRAERAFDWVTLPAEGRVGRPPSLPPLRPWSKQTREWWAWLWSTPQAVMWEPSGRTLHALAILHHHLVTDVEGAKVASVAAEMRGHEDRHGLTPKALLQLRWRIKEPLAARVAGGQVLQLVTDTGLAKPRKSDRKAVWVEWAVACGADPDEALALGKGQLVEMFGEARVDETPAATVRVSAADRLRGGS